MINTKNDPKVPNTSLKSLWGFRDEEGVQIDIEALKEIETIDTFSMNPLELACSRGHHELL